MGLFEKRQSISRDELKETIKKHNEPIPGTGGKRYTQKEREELARELLEIGPSIRDTQGLKINIARRLGGDISKSDFQTIIRSLKAAGGRVQDRKQKDAIYEKVRFLKKLGGV